MNDLVTLGNLRLVLGLSLALVVAPAHARADWSLNVGYQNPIVSTVGVNALYQGSKWAFEAGIGWIDVSANDDDEDKDKPNGTAANDAANDEDDDPNARLRLAGDVDLKYLFASGGARPYLQAGFGVGLGAAAGEDGGASAGTGGGFAGLGILLGSKSVYGYGSLNLGGGGDAFVQAGIGFDI